MTTYSNAVKVILIIYFAMLAVEWLLSLILKKKIYNTLDAVSGMSSGLTNNVKSLLKLTVIILSYEWMVGHLALFEMKASVTAYILCFIGFDFAYYWRHRWAHEINFLWNRHLIHHSSEEFNLSAGMRQPISGFIELYFFLYIPVALLGIPTVVVAVIAPLHRFAQFWYHTRLINRMGFLEHIIVTPSHHRVHHAINKEYLDKNFSAIFIVWDKWFGTYEEEQDTNPPVFGIKRAAQTWNPFLINFMHIWQLIKDCWHTQHLADKFRIWYKPTGWRPADVMEKYPVTSIEDAHTQIKYKTQSTPLLTSWFLLQVVLHIAVQFHFLELLPMMSYWYLLIYGLFVGLSIFSYTALMDRSWVALPAEIIKTLLGFSILNYFGGWFLLQESFQLSTPLMIAYLMCSLIITIYYSIKRDSLTSITLQEMK